MWIKAANQSLVNLSLMEGILIVNPKSNVFNVIAYGQSMNEECAPEYYLARFGTKPEAQKYLDQLCFILGGKDLNLFF
ncbi:hypothetical protein PCC7424_0142 [Gloeothece citriformis PCC 7424]|uniref:Uncharacterized protein n=1 Tax=Gloeothece citriformis (strain PCC 7424) TaxID=65393 RepID=B7K9C9_GLOC7|nr:hypothetical protein [Gloeothece citriformis]ACK68612.1 hypothetical protein PCC7424_0142 [Gloeothece citriformis PCC 7424]